MQQKNLTTASGSSPIFAISNQSTYHQTQARGAVLTFQSLRLADLLRFGGVSQAPCFHFLAEFLAVYSTFIFYHETYVLYSCGIIFFQTMWYIIRAVSKLLPACTTSWLGPTLGLYLRKNPAVHPRPLKARATISNG
jgi:hypothetical protein